jgi:competence protein ComEA
MTMSSAPSGVLSRAAARVIGSRFAKPIARAVLVAAGLFVLAFVGRTAVAGALGGPTPPASSSSPDRSFAPGPPSAVAAPATMAPASTSETGATPRVAASPEAPVVLNTATADDLRRLPGIGEKRAGAILALRTRLGRFRAVEDLLKVKGIGRATLKRLRSLVRLDPVAPSDAGPTPMPPRRP